MMTKTAVVSLDLLSQIAYCLGDRSAGNAKIWDEINRILEKPELHYAIEIDPDCRDGKHGSCIGCDCAHHQILGERPRGLEEGEDWDERLLALCKLMEPA